VQAGPGTRPVTRKDLLKKDLRKAFLKHQLVSSTTSRTSKYLVEEQSHTIWNAKHDASVKKIFQSAIL
jgi:hypothetical protein